MIDRFARYYTPIVALLAALVALLPPLILGEPILVAGAGSDSWFYRGLALLIVACPCALVISTPVSIVSAIGNAARNGVLVKGGAALEQLGRVKTIVFDKTGTLTDGKPSVIAIRALSCSTPNLNPMLAQCDECRDLLALASAVERRSEHPVAGAIVRASTAWGVENMYGSAADVTAMSGLGVMGQVNGRQVIIGSHRFFDTAIPHSSQHCDLAQLDAQQGYTPMMLSFDGDYQGTITVADSLRWNGPQVIERLQDAGVEHVAMLTGDNRQTAETIGAQVGIANIRSELLPEDKMSAVEQLRNEFGPLAMVGDGINDSPALATADVGIAIGNGIDSTNKAMETADITLMAPDLQRLPFIYTLSRKTISIIRTNIFLSLAIKAIFLVLVLLGLGTLWMAVLADVGTSLLVTLNGARLLRWKQT
jgi:Cd2+/Zn2+-exporting ATPase